MDKHIKLYNKIGTDGWNVCINKMRERRDSLVGKSSASQAEDLGANPGGSLTWVTQCMNKRGRDY